MDKRLNLVNILSNQIGRHITSKKHMMINSNSRSQNPHWVQCEGCSINILKKDVERHTNDCPPSPNKSKDNYNYVENGILYGTLDIKNNEEIKGVTYTDSLVFLSQSAIQLCSLAIGQWAILKLKAGPPVAKIVWPTVEKTSTSVLLTKAALELTSNEINSEVMVQKLTEKVAQAHIITVVLLNKPKSMEITADLVNRLHKVFVDKIYCPKNKLSVLYFGKVLVFEIKSIQGRVDTLEDQLETLTLDQYKFYIVTNNTSWNIYNDEADFNKKENEVNLITKIGGLDKEISEIREAINAAIGSSSNSYGMNYGKSILLFGNSGTGKTLVANALAKESRVNVISICASDLYSKYSGNPEQIVKHLFDQAVDLAPTIIILDEIDILCPVRSQRMTDSEKRVVSTVLTSMEELNRLSNCPVFIIATTSKPEAIDPAFRRCGRLDRELEIPTPSAKARKDILFKLINNLMIKLDENELNEIARITHGFVGADLVALCSRAGLNASNRNAKIVEYQDFQAAMKLVRPSAMREVQVDVANVKWSDIGGLDQLKHILRQSVEWPQKYPDSFVRLGITPPKGILLYGPPGCSKTMIAKALATETGLNFISIKGPELFSKWVGESERAIREVFRKGRQVAPSIIFFDEIDALGSERSSGSSTSVQERVLAQLLTELDGVSPLGDVTVVAATNRPDKIDKALLRPGRLDRIIYVSLPNSETRREIFKLKFLKMPISKDVDLSALVSATEGYSGAEVSAVCHEAGMFALEEDINAQIVSQSHFTKALRMVPARTSPALLDLYENYNPGNN